MIDVQGLTRYYGDNKAVEGLSFRIESHEIIGFLGLNGAGKTTTLKILAGIMLPTSGAVCIDGLDLLTSPMELRRRIGFLPEIPPLHKEMVVRDYLRFAGGLRGMKGASLDAEIEDVARRTSIAHVLDQVIDTLSYGYQKRVGIAQCIIHKPTLVILDEPIGGLDPVQIVEIRNVIAGLKEHCTVLVSSHILSEVSQTCDRILVLHEGRIVAEGTEEDLARRFGSSTRLQLILRGDHKALEQFLARNPLVLSHEVVEDQGETLRVKLVLKGDEREQLARDLISSGFGLRRMDDSEAELEQIFINLTRQEAA